MMAVTSVGRSSNEGECTGSEIWAEFDESRCELRWDSMVVGWELGQN